MTVNKEKKNKRQRAGTTHGCGSMKKRRGAGHRGGRGMAGTGKRADTKKPSIDINTYFGGHGFVCKKQKPLILPLNIIDLERNLDNFVSMGIAEKQGDLTEVDFTKLGDVKLLGKGQVTQKLKVKVAYATNNAVEKIQQAGGEVQSEEQKESEVEA